ncbi:PspC domain-containing protein [Patescibacteria group bacterium]|nr:PspC domain-containing protein [Patescibacteria group bacterium]
MAKEIKKVINETKMDLKDAEKKQERKAEEKWSNTAPSRLYRSEKNAIIGGVAQGLGEYFNIDPTIIRLLFVLFTIIHGSGVLLYIVLWIVLPTKDKVMNTPEDTKQIVKDNFFGIRDRVCGFVQGLQGDKGNNGRVIVGLLLLVFGVIILFDNLGLRIGLDIGKFWPLILVLLGFYILSKK